MSSMCKWICNSVLTMGVKLFFSRSPKKKKSGFQTTTPTCALFWRAACLWASVVQWTSKDTRQPRYSLVGKLQYLHLQPETLWQKGQKDELVHQLEAYKWIHFIICKCCFTQARYPLCIFLYGTLSLLSPRAIESLNSVCMPCQTGLV